MKGKLKNNSGITLIALVVTIIILLILAGVSLKLIEGSEGIIAKARWSEYVTEYEKVDEAKEMYVAEKMMEKYGSNSSKSVKKEYKIASLEGVENLSAEDKIIYPVTEKIEIAKMPQTLKATIMKNENLSEEELLNEEKVNLYKVDFSKIEVEVKREYTINIQTGILYSIDAEIYKGNVYHIPRFGVTQEGNLPPEEKEDEEEKQDTEDTIYLRINQTKNLDTKLKNGALEWFSSDESIVTVDQNGRITGIAKGEAIVTVTYQTEDTGDTELPDDTEEGNGEEDEEETVTTRQTYRVIVEDGIPDEFTLTLEDITITEYQTATLEAKIDGIKVGTGYLEWETSDESTVKVDSKGNVKGLKIGEAIITCKWKEDESKTASCKVTVKMSDTLILDKTQMSITINQTGKITAKYKGTDVTNTANWSAENENITVNKGKITGITAGETKVIAEYQGETAVCNVTVNDFVTEIYTIEDLSLFATQVNSGNKFEGKTVRLMNNLDFKDAESYESTESPEYNNYYVNTTTWVRIGNSTSKYFSGIFDGAGNTIANLYINATAANQGLFGYSKGGTFKDLTLNDVNITSNKYQVGGVLGNGASVNISNCKVSGSISSTGQTSNYNRTGGIVGLIGTAGGNISGCVNEATIGGSYHCKAGIVGQMYKGTIMNCINKGNVISKNAYVAGIAGTAGNGANVNYTTTIENCKNYAEIQGQCYIGGITGMLNQSSSVKNCINYNTGTINATGYNSTTYYDSEAGGIVGLIAAKGENKVENCQNFANISGTYNGAGGIVGTSMRGTVKNCQNEGEIVGARIGTGGIAGRTGYYNTTRKVYTKSIIDSCENKGIVNSTGHQVGGISGKSERGSEIKNCNNYANVTGTGRNDSTHNWGMVGGIVGNQSLYLYNSIGCLVENCNNYGEIKSTYQYCGGIVGWHERGTVKNCKNEGSVTNERAQTGGITGATGRYDDDYKTNGTIEGCLNKGNVTITGTGASCQNAGGISGNIIYGSSITKSANTGDVTTKGYSTSTEKASRIGGIVGVMNSYGANKVTYCYNTGNVTGSYKWIGGIAGLMNTTTAIIDHCYSKGTITGPAKIGGIVGYKKGTVTESYYLENSVVPTSGDKTDEGEEKDMATIDAFIKALNINE